MAFFSFFDKKTTPVECPRCLGKGFVNEADIRRLKMELKWRPGSCAYCSGTGKVSEEQLEKIPVDLTYLCIDLPGKEALKILRGDKKALANARKFNENIESNIQLVKEMYFKEGWPAEKITKFFFTIHAAHYKDDNAKEEFRQWVNQIIGGEENKEQDD